MSEQDKHVRHKTSDLQERAWELDCLYQIDSLLRDPEVTPDDILRGIAQAIPFAWEHPEAYRVRITLRESIYQSPGFPESSHAVRADICMEREPVGAIEVSHAQWTLQDDESVFPPPERKLISSIAERVGHFLSLQHLSRCSKLRGRLDREDEIPDLRRPKEETSRPIPQGAGHRGLCLTCVHSSSCPFLRREDRPVLSSEESDDREGGSAVAADSANDFVRGPQAEISEESHEPSGYSGLCVTCEHRETCVFPRPLGGVWHCEEFL